MDRKTFVSLIEPNSKAPKIVGVNKSFDKDKQFSYFTFEQMELVKNKVISMSTFTILCWMNSCPEGWVFRKTHMYEMFERRAVDKAYKELTSVGLLVSINYRDGQKTELATRVFAQPQSPEKAKQICTRMIERLRSEGKKNLEVNDLQWQYFCSEPVEEDKPIEEEQATETKEIGELTVLDLLDGLELDEENISHLEVTQEMATKEYDSRDEIPEEGQEHLFKMIRNFPTLDIDGRPSHKALISNYELGIIYTNSMYKQNLYNNSFIA